MQKVLRFSSVFLLTALLVMPVAVFAQTETNPDKVFSDAAQALGNQGVEASLAYFADDAIIKETPAFTTKNVGTFTGKQQVRQWLQGLFDTHSFGTSVGSPEIKGDKVTYLIQVKSDELKKAGIDGIITNQEVVVTGGKIKRVTITATPISLTELQQKGFTSGTSQGQGGSATPTGAPATGFGLTHPDNDRLNLPLGLIALISLSGSGLWLIRRWRRR